MKTPTLTSLLFVLFLFGCSNNDEPKLELTHSDFIGVTLMDPLNREYTSDHYFDTVYYEFLDEQSMKATLLDYSDETGEIAFKEKEEFDCYYFIEDGNKLVMILKSVYNSSELSLYRGCGHICQNYDLEVLSFTKDTMIVDLCAHKDGRIVGHDGFSVTKKPSNE